LFLKQELIVVVGGGGEMGQAKKSETNSEVEELKIQLENERKQRNETEKELSLQVRGVLTSGKERCYRRCLMAEVCIKCCAERLIYIYVRGWIILKLYLCS
jgi:hypothetical protein